MTLLSVSLWSASACPLTPALEQATAQAARTAGLDVHLLRALLWQESRFCHLTGGKTTVSPAGALGVGQLMPATAAALGTDPHDEAANITGAARYLRTQWDTFGDWHLALAAYNAGPGAVQRYGGVPPYGETQAYVMSVLETYGAMKTQSDPLEAVVRRKEPRRVSAVVYRR